MIDQIASSIRSVEGVSLLNVDPGAATNRTVYTFVGEPEAVLEAAFRAAKTGAALINMESHQGEHPRMGFLDVCPLIPISGVTMEEAVAYSKQLAQRLAEELQLSVYLYEASASSPQRRNLADIRAGEYEALPSKLNEAQWKPDYGPTVFQPRLGATVVGARDFLIAYNVNLNTTSVRRANAIAFDVREKGRVRRSGDPLTGEILRNDAGEPLYEAGSLKGVKAIGWFIEEYGIAQISMNLTNLKETPVHRAFDEVCEKASLRGVRVTGSEVVGLVPLESVLEAGRYFLRKQQRSVGVSDEELVRTAVRSLGLSELSAFDPKERIIEYAIEDKESGALVCQSVQSFVETTASEAPAPGGGSVAAAVGALGAALGTMVANLSAHKRGWDARWEEFSDWAERGKERYVRLLQLIDEDTNAFHSLMNAFGLPKSSDEEKETRGCAIQSATIRAIESPLAIMEEASNTLPVLNAMAEHGNPNSISDAGVGALCIRSCVDSAYMNVLINLPGCEDAALRAEFLARAEAIRKDSGDVASSIAQVVEERLKALLP